MKIALAMIVKGSPEEAEVLNRCLDNIIPYVDKAFVTATYKKDKKEIGDVVDVAEFYGAQVSDFKWQNDFAAARNFNFSQVPKDYDYILWLDADDILQNAWRLQEIIKENSTVDAFAFWYYYDIDSHNNPTVVHKKTQLVRNDGSVEWIGKLHEDFKENRSLNVKFVEGIERVHLTTNDRVRVAQERNVDISKEEAKANPNDPRVYFNLANSYFGAGKYKEAKTTYQKFLEESQSEEEKYVVHQRLSSVHYVLGNKNEAIEHLQLSIGMSPDLPDSYNLLGKLYFDYGMMDNAEKYLLLGLAMKPKYHAMIVYNPRDYDYNPMMALAKVYFNKARPDYALPLLKGCLKIYPNDDHVKGLVREMEVEQERLVNVLNVIQRLEGVTDKMEIMAEINLLPADLQAHPAICRIRNEHFVKTESTGKDIAYYCGQTTHTWNPDLFETEGFGGSEEAVINLAKQWAKLGYNVTVFNSCGLSVMERDGVTYKPFWYYNAKDKYDYTVLWRSPILANYELNTGKIFVDMHDVIPEGEFNEARMKRIDRIFVKTHAHRALFPNIPDHKFAVVPNGIDLGLFTQDVQKDPMMLVNTSSPDRSMDVLPRLFKEIKKRVPGARMVWAYGWTNFDNSFSGNKEKMAWKEKIIAEMQEAGIEDMGRLSQRECAKLYLEGSILAYPSEFYEIDCISVRKSQACGCVPVTTDFAAFAESNRFGVQVPSSKKIDNWCLPYQESFGISEKKTQKAWVDAVVDKLQKPLSTEKMKEWSKKFDWEIIAEQWSELF